MKKIIFPTTFLIILCFCGYFFSGTENTDIEPKDNTSDKKISLIFTGDIMLDRGVELKIKNAGDGDFRFPFLKITDYLKSADLTFGNLEGPISDKGYKVGSENSFRFDPKAIDGLTLAGFDVLSVANNHMIDYTGEALRDTFLRLKTAGIDYVGGGFNATEAGTPIIKEIENTKFAFLAYTSVCIPQWKPSETTVGINCVSEADIEKVKEQIQTAKKMADVVIVSIHTGNEYTQNITKFQNDFSKAAVDAGADLVIGHHPHVAQKYETYKNKYIFYSLGNFIFDQNFSTSTMQGLMVRVTVENKKIKEIIPVKVHLNSNFQAEMGEVKGISFSPAQTSPSPTPTPKPVATPTVPSVTISLSSAKQGSTIIVEVKNAKISEISGTFNSKTLKFFTINGKIFSLVGIDAKMKAGSYKLTVTFSGGKKIEKTIKVTSGNFPTTVLAFTPELEDKGFSATSVPAMIKDDSAKLYQALATSSPTAYFTKSFFDPLDKIVDLGAFGNIRKSGETSLQHLGTDLQASMNTKVYAINDGVIKATLNLVDYGNTIVIDHGLGIFSLYLHLNEFKVQTGQSVKRGQIIGLSGNTGYSIAPHLHFSIKANGASVDPIKFINAAQF
jgi:poly-gamma-glutamate capsule biosynthesis protein CapA/YwtB (metallophosphatase superfamily)